MTAQVLDLSIAEELASIVTRGGGTMKLTGGIVELFLPDELDHLLPRMKEHKLGLVALLQRCGGWIACQAKCPQCGSYALYRKNNRGAYECLTCESQGIEEATARRPQ